MNSIILVLFFASAATATFVITTTAAALSATQVGSLVSGVGLIKVLALKALLISGLLSNQSRRRRDVTTESPDLSKEFNKIFEVIQENEPKNCLQRLICEIASGNMPQTENDVILSLFEDPNSIDESSPMKKFANAAKMGQKSRNVKNCQIRYSCPLNGLEMEELLN